MELEQLEGHSHMAVTKKKITEMRSISLNLGWEGGTMPSEGT